MGQRQATLADYAPPILLLFFLLFLLLLVVVVPPPRHLPGRRRDYRHDPGHHLRSHPPGVHKLPGRARSQGVSHPEQPREEQAPRDRHHGRRPFPPGLCEPAVGVLHFRVARAHPDLRHPPSRRPPARPHHQQPLLQPPHRIRGGLHRAGRGRRPERVRSDSPRPARDAPRRPPPGPPLREVRKQVLFRVRPGPHARLLRRED
mmetsp:Transcript_14865/g.29600  ORF Transcript_14865/g.29600 Transcript_14865/m.29600 type:complete len:203 (-) Transcript_14865:144-752(-)